jgi:hypothetical protein
VWAIEEGRKCAEQVDLYLEQLGDRAHDRIRHDAGARG